MSGPTRDWSAPILWVLLFLAVVVGVSLVVTISTARLQSESVGRELKARAAACRVLMEMGVDLDPGGPCLEDDVLPYYPDRGQDE